MTGEIWDHDMWSSEWLTHGSDAVEDGDGPGGGSSVENVGEAALVAVDPVGERGQRIRRHSPISDTDSLSIRN